VQLDGMARDVLGQMLFVEVSETVNVTLRLLQVRLDRVTENR
jgi:hypothetical protein